MKEEKINFQRISKMQKNKGKEQAMQNTGKGITLIALVITIVVLLILSGITISLVFGDNGIVKKSQDAKKSYSFAELKEQLLLLMQDIKINQYATNEKIDIRSEIKNKFENYPIYYDSDNSIRVFTEKGTISLDESYQLTEEKDTSIYKENVAELKASEDVKEGDIVYTLGYYTRADNGESKYVISADETLVGDDGKVIQLNNGLKAVLQIENNTVTVEQFGAHGDGNTNDYQYFQQAIDSGAKTILLGNKEFLIDQRVVINKDGLTLISYRKNKMFFDR